MCQSKRVAINSVIQAEYKQCMILDLKVQPLTVLSAPVIYKISINTVIS